MNKLSQAAIVIILLNFLTIDSQANVTSFRTYFYRPCLTRERPTLTLYYTSYCPYSLRVLHYLQQIHKTVPMKNVEGNAQFKSELLRIGGKLQVPCLVIDGIPLYESDEIIDWLCKHQDLLNPA